MAGPAVRCEQRDSEHELVKAYGHFPPHARPNTTSSYHAEGRRDNANSDGSSSDAPNFGRFTWYEFDSNP